MADKANPFQVALDRAAELQEEKKSVLSDIDENRKFLRGCVSQGLITGEAAEYVNSLYPTKTRMSPEEKVAELEEKLAAAQEKAAA